MDAPTNTGGSASRLLSTLIPVIIFAGVYFLIFLVVRTKYKRIYSPRSFVGSLRPQQRTPALNDGMFNWFGQYFGLADSYVLKHHSLDGYLLLRFLKLCVITCLVGCLITWPVLFPVNATGGGGLAELDIITMANVGNQNQYFQYFAHVGCAYIFFGFVLFMITRESIFYINLRQAYLVSRAYAERISSRTVLFTSVPEHYLVEANLRRMLGPSVVRVWYGSNTKDVDEAVEERDKTAIKLEGAETKLVMTANKKRVKEIKAANKKAGKKTNNADGTPLNDNTTEDVEAGAAAKYLTPKDRPTHKLKFLIGKKVDTIDWCRAELQTLIPKAQELQNKHRNHQADKIGAVFVEFADMAQAQAAFQSLAHHQALHMAPRYTGMVPGEIIWSNLRIKWWERVIRKFAVIAAVVALVIFWSVLTAGVGSISNIDKLIEIPAFSWLSFINSIPSVIRGVVTGLLPVILLAILMAVLPIFLRLMAKTAGAVTYSQVELSVQNYYFAFQIVNVFFAATLGSSAAASAQGIVQDPTSVPSILAASIPTASGIFLSYFVLQGLAVVASKLLRLAGLVIFLVLSKLLDKTPRKMYKRWFTLSSIGWGTLLPIYTNLFVIAICYACIAPLVLIFAAIGMYLFYLAHRYDLLFVSDAQIDTQGKLYPRALKHLFVGLYVAEFCLIGLFAIGTGSGNGAIGPLILMIAFLVFTALYHISLNSALQPLIDYLPKNLVAEQNLASGSNLGSASADIEKGSDYNEKDRQPQNANVLDTPAPHKKPNLLMKFLKPHIYNDFATMQRLVADRLEPAPIPEADAQLAYFDPSITGEIPYLWIPRDPLGISRTEVAETSQVTRITDEYAHLDADNKIVYDYDRAEQLPVYQKPIDY